MLEKKLTKIKVPPGWIEQPTSPLRVARSTTELRRHCISIFLCLYGDHGGIFLFKFQPRNIVVEYVFSLLLPKGRKKQISLVTEQSKPHHNEKRRQTNEQFHKGK